LDQDTLSMVVILKFTIAMGMTDGVLLNLDLMNKVLQVDKEKKLVTVEAGIRLKDLNIILKQHGLALSNLGTIADQSISGAIITGTHGSSSVKNGRVTHGSLSTFITSFEMIDGLGNIHIASKDKNPDLLNAGRISLGALGIITKLTIQCEDFFNIEKEEFLIPVPEALDNLEKYFKENDFVKFWYFPFAEKIRVTTYKKTNKDLSVKGIVDKITEIVETPIFLNVLYLGGWIGSSMMHKLFAIMMAPKTFKIVESYNAFAMSVGDGVPQPYAQEYMLPIEKFIEFHQEFRSYLSNSPIQTNIWNEIRFIRKDDENWLSPFQVDSVSIDIGLHNQTPERWKQFHTGAENIFKKYGGRGHWAKTFTKSKQELEKDYPKFNDFKKMREKMDPHGIYFNKYLKDIFE
jgi:FAD/FMN-containing dehydrogenase